MQNSAKNSGKSNLIAGATGDWEVVIGMEVHAQVASASKLFSGSSTSFGADPNSHVSLVDAAMPGMLPVINKECVAQAIRTGLGIKAAINLKSVFDRKNYFYPDLPQGYQISQYKQPIVGEGEIDEETRVARTRQPRLPRGSVRVMRDELPGRSVLCVMLRHEAGIIGTRTDSVSIGAARIHSTARVRASDGRPGTRSRVSLPARISRALHPKA